jgi:hypothetical protein
MGPVAPSRAGEAGLSMMEALIIVTLTALIALMILPMAQQSSKNAISISHREIDISAAARGETAFRELLGAASQPRVSADAPPTLIGNQAGLVVHVSSEGRQACVDAGTEGYVRLAIVRRGQGGALVCTSGAAMPQTLIAWDEGEAAFSYSEGGAWGSSGRLQADTTMHRAALVRFSLYAQGLPRLDWVSQAGWTQPARIAPDAGAAAQGQAQAP